MDLSSALDLAIALCVLAGMVAGGVYKLRRWLRDDTEGIVRKYTAPIVATQVRHASDIEELQIWRPIVDRQLRTHGEDIAYLRGKEDARRELSQAASAVVELVHHDKEEE